MTRLLRNRQSAAQRQALAQAVHESYMEVFPSASIEHRLDPLMRSKGSKDTR